MADNKKEKGLDDEVKDSEGVSRESSNLERDGGSQASGQNVTGEAVQREESFAKKKKGKMKGKRAKRQDDDEALERGDSFTGPEKGKKKGKKGKKTKQVRVPDEESKQKEQIELIALEGAGRTTDKKVKMETTNIDNKLIQEGQETDIIAPIGETTGEDSEQNKDELLESSGDEKKDSEKESPSDEDNTIKDGKSKVTEKDNGVKDIGGEEIRRRPTLSELRSASVEGTDETTAVASNENLESVKEDAKEKQDQAKEGIPPTESPATTTEQKEAEVVIEVERKISKDALTSIKVVSTEQTEQVAVSLEQVTEESDSISVVTKEQTEHVTVSVSEDADKTDEEKVLEVTVETTEEKITTEKTQEMSAEVQVEAADDKKPEPLSEVTTGERTQEMSAEVTVEVEAVADHTGSPSEVTAGEEEVKDDVKEEADGKPFLEYEIDDELPWAMYRSLDAPLTNKAPVEEEDEWPQSEEEEEYEPPTKEELPDIDELMGTLDGGESELETSAPPPPVILPEDKAHQQKKIDELKLGLAEERMDSYLDDFERRMEEEILMIGQISLEEVQEEERRLRDEHISYQQQEAKVQRERIQDIMSREERTKKYIMAKLKEKRKAILRREEHLMQQDRLIQNRIHRAFRRAENQLLKALKARKGEVKTMYGDLILADGQYGGSKGRRWKVDWNRTPQPIQIKLKCLRGVKDKLPGGRYVLMVSLYDRLGGHVLKWSNLKGQQWGGATLPLHHDGEFFNIEMKIDQSVFTVCPARPDVRPGMCLVFELFVLRGSVTATDRVVGWGCFPICDGEFNIVEGKYKSPFLRGDMDPSIDKHEKVEELMAQDLENWLCNLYFEVVKLPRYMAGQKEYEVELQFTSGLVGYPARTNTGEEFIDGEEPVYGSKGDLKSLASPTSSRRPSRISMLGGSSFLGSTMDLKGESKDQLPGSTVDLQVEVPDLSTMPKRKLSLAVPDAGTLRRSSIVSQTRRMSSVSTTRRMSRPMTVNMSRKAIEMDASSEGSGTDYSDDEVLMLKKDDGFKPVKGQPGMYYKKHHNNPVDVYAKKMFTMLPKTALLTRRKKKKKLTHTEELEQHSFSVKQPFSNKGHVHHRGREKMQYVGRQLMAELGLSQWRSREFWAMMLMIAFTWFLRLYTHYGGQWLYLTALIIPINKFEFLPYTVNLNYQTTLLHTEEEIALVILGPFTNILIFCVLVIAAWAIQRLFGIFPNIFSRFIMALGINILLDPLWIIIVDSALQRYRNVGGDLPIGDAFKLYWHFDRYEKNGAVGIVLTIFLYIVTLFASSTILYMYFLRLHNNGRLMDVYHRLHATEDDFFIPYDLEISNEELNFICKKSEQWRGEEGERKKTAVYDYIWEEEQVDEAEINEGLNKTGRREITTHVSVHTLHLDGLRELYRHFLRLPDGAIVEVFNEINLAGMDEGIKQALIKGTTYQAMDNTTASKTSLRSRGRSSSVVSSTSFRRPSVLLEVPKAARSSSPV